MSFIDALGAMNSNQKTASTGSGFNQLDGDAFLQLLVAQLKYQNPMNPVDGQEYLAQAAQFASVERLDHLSKAQSESVAYQQVLLSTSLVGKHVAGGTGDARIDGIVDAVRFEQGVPILLVGSERLPLSMVEEVQQASPS